MSDVKVPEQLANVNVLKITGLLRHMLSVDTLVGDPNRTIVKTGEEQSLSHLRMNNRAIQSKQGPTPCLLPS